MPTITPCLWFDGKAEEAARFYTSLFPNSRVEGDGSRATAVRILHGHGAHFVNLHGRFATEEIEAWRGPELDIPDLLRR